MRSHAASLTTFDVIERVGEWGMKLVIDMSPHLKEKNSA